MESYQTTHVEKMMLLLLHLLNHHSTSLLVRRVKAANVWFSYSTTGFNNCCYSKDKFQIKNVHMTDSLEYYFVFKFVLVSLNRLGLTFGSPSAVSTIQTVINQPYKSPVNTDKTVLLTTGETLPFPTTRMCISFTKRNLQLAAVMNHAFCINTRRVIKPTE